MTFRACRLTLALASSLSLSGTGGCTHERSDASLQVTSCGGMQDDATCHLPSTLLGHTTAGELTLRNTGVMPLVISQIGAGSTLPASLSLSPGDCPDRKLFLDESCTIRITFAPSSVGAEGGEFTFATDAPSARIVTVAVSAAGALDGITLEVTPCAGGTLGELRCQLAPIQAVGATSSGVLTLRNAGPTEPLLVFDVGTDDGLASPFTLAGDTCTGNPLSVNETCTLGVSFTPSVAGAYHETLSFATNSDEGAAVTIQVTGVASFGWLLPILEVTPCTGGTVGELQCYLPPMQPVGTTASGVLTLRNAGTGSLDVFDVGATDGLASPFELSSDTCTGNPLSVGETCTLGVSFSSAVAGTFHDTFSFATNAPNSAVVTIQVAGDAAAP
jgi:hypothetical protein